MKSLGLWEQLHNHDFKLLEFGQFKIEAGTNALFGKTAQEWQRMNSYL